MSSVPGPLIGSGRPGLGNPQVALPVAGLAEARLHRSEPKRAPREQILRPQRAREQTPSWRRRSCASKARLAQGALSHTRARGRQFFRQHQGLGTTGQCPCPACSLPGDAGQSAARPQPMCRPPSSRGRRPEVPPAPGNGSRAEHFTRRVVLSMPALRVPCAIRAVTPGAAWRPPVCCPVLSPSGRSS